MDYTEIVNLALSYSDREDAEVEERMDDFLKIVEARINRKLQVQRMSVRTLITTKIGQEYYGLPVDFGGLRDIEIRPVDSESGGRSTLKYMSPEQMNSYSGSNGTNIYYTIIANQIQIMGPQDNMILEIVYYKYLTKLSLATPENWASIYNPDLYTFGLLVEISSFAKDAVAKELWDARFKEALAEIKDDDQDTRWSGTALEIRIG